MRYAKPFLYWGSMIVCIVLASDSFGWRMPHTLVVCAVTVLLFSILPTVKKPIPRALGIGAGVVLALAWILLMRFLS